MADIGGSVGCWWCNAIKRVFARKRTVLFFSMSVTNLTVMLFASDVVSLAIIPPLHSSTQWFTVLGRGTTFRSLSIAMFWGAE